MKKHKFFIAVLAGYFLLELIILWRLGSIYTLVHSDSASYLNTAENLLKSGFFSQDGANADFFRTPGYPLFLSAFLFFSKRLIFVQIGQIILSCATLSMIYGTILTVSQNKKWALTGCLLFAFDLMHYRYDITILSETLFCFLLSLSLLSMSLFIAKRKNYHFLTFSISLNYALFTRPILVYFNILVCVALFVLAYKQKIQYKQAFVFITLFFLTFAGWSLRNYRHGGVFIYSTVRNYNLLYFDSALLKAGMENIGEIKARQELDKEFKNAYDTQGLTEAQKSVLYAKAGRQYLNAHKLAYLRRNIKGAKVLLFHVERPSSRPRDRIIRYCSYICLFILYCFYGFGFLRKFTRRDLTIIDLFIATLCLYLVLASASVGYPRFRVPFMPLMLAGVFLLYAAKVRKVRHLR
jgi:hypothetical protein